MREAFARLWHLSGCLWLDSATIGPEREAETIGRFSFLTADPLRVLKASVGECSPWPTLQRWVESLPDCYDPSLPPFQGGIAGLIGYESASWLEPVGLARTNDLPTSAMVLGVYDWTLAKDHQNGKAWLICQQMDNDYWQTDCDPERRADQIQALLSGEPTEQRLDPPASKTTIQDQYSTEHDGVTSNFSGKGFRARVAEIVRRICDGDSFQVNIAQRLLCKASCDSRELYLRLRDQNPAPFGGYFGGDDFQVLSSSPEGFLTVRDRIVQTRPIKGTIHRTGDPAQDEQLAQQLSDSEKDRAENIMIVDLLRNDLSRVCEDNSVVVQQLCEVESYQYVQHLVSVVEGKLREDQSIVDLLMACFPGGSITGAPKIEAMRTIADLEPNQRGPYCGTLGYIGCGGQADFNILIRTITAAHGHWQIPVGGGITAKSNPAAEEAETWNKAEGMLRAI